MRPESNQIPLRERHNLDPRSTRRPDGVSPDATAHRQTITMAAASGTGSVLSRAVRIFEAFDPDTPVMTISELSRRTDLPTTTTSRLVSELASYGWLHRDNRQRVWIGVRIWELVSRASPTLLLREAALPFMQDLHAVVGHHVQLAILHDREVLYIERLSAPGAIRNVSRYAGRLPLHASAPGLVLLANGTVELQNSVLTTQLPAYTRHTVTDPVALRALLSEVRRTGIAYCVGHLDESATAMAVPLRSGLGKTVAALTVIVPNDARAYRITPALQATARGISRVFSRPP